MLQRENKRHISGKIYKVSEGREKGMQKTERNKSERESVEKVRKCL